MDLQRIEDAHNEWPKLRQQFAREVMGYYGATPLEITRVSLTGVHDLCHTQNCVFNQYIGWYAARVLQQSAALPTEDANALQSNPMLARAAEAWPNMRGHFTAQCVALYTDSVTIRSAVANSSFERLVADFPFYHMAYFGWFAEFVGGPGWGKAFADKPDRSWPGTVTTITPEILGVHEGDTCGARQGSGNNFCNGFLKIVGDAPECGYCGRRGVFKPPRVIIDGHDCTDEMRAALQQRVDMSPQPLTVPAEEGDELGETGGDTCGLLKCPGVLERADKPNCSCHLVAPCPDCLDAVYHCPLCDRRTDE